MGPLFSAFGLINFKMPGNKHWQWTANNPTDDELNYIRWLGTLPANLAIKYIAFGHEVGNGGTPHLQGCIGFTQRKSFAMVRAVFGNINPHIEQTNNPLRNYRYATKVRNEGGIVEEFGEVPTNGQGGRSDLDAFQDAIRNGARLDDIREQHYAAYTRNTGAAREFILQHMPYLNPEFHALREWQQQLYQTLTLPVDNRVVHFVVDPTGNGGKSWFCHYYEWMRHPIPNDVLILRPTKRDNLSYIFFNAHLNRVIRTVFLDVTRTFQDVLNYDFLEELKDGFMVVGKYGSTNIRFARPHVVVMMNQQPDLSKLSADRYHIINI